jgi:hypothetical protein
MIIKGLSSGWKVYAHITLLLIEWHTGYALMRFLEAKYREYLV